MLTTGLIDDLIEALKSQDHLVYSVSIRSEKLCNEKANLEAEQYKLSGNVQVASDEILPRSICARVSQNFRNSLVCSEGIIDGILKGLNQ